MSHQLPAGTILHGRYRIESVIGQGGFGITYKAHDPGLNQWVCIKELFPSGLCVRGPENTVVFQGKEALDFPGFRKRFIREAQELARFRHPNIVRVSEVFEANQTAYFVMDFVEGETLRDRVLREGRLKPEQALPLMHSLLDAVETVHNAGMLHRDIKPDNVLVEPSGKVVLIDFGSAKSFEGGRTLSQTAILTPGYAPLEQYSDTAARGPFTDIYALGATFYFMLTGHKPLAAIDRQENVLQPPHSLFPDISDILSSAIMLALNLRAADRFQTVADMRDALKTPIRQHAEKQLDKELELEKEQFQLLRKRKRSDGSFSFSDNQELESLLKKAKEGKGHEWQTLRRLIESESSYTRSNMGLIAIIVIILISSVFLIYGYVSSSKASENVSYKETVQTNEMNADQVSQAPLQEAMDTLSSSRDNQEDLYRKAYLDSLRMDSILKQELATHNSNELTNTNTIIQRLLNNMVFVQGGSFTMGCTNEQSSDCASDENPAHSVQLSSFKIGKYEVTQEEWEAVMGNNPSRFSNCPKCPVEQVSWNDVQGFINALNRQTGWKFRLPTEAEWEYAARGGNRSGGHKYSGSDNIATVAWYDGNSGSRTHPVGQKAANVLGLHDMSGNVWEWCSDWYGENYYGNSPGSNPHGPGSGTNRVFRGGSWLSLARDCRLSCRGGFHPGFRNSPYGFRLVSPSS